MHGEDSQTDTDRIATATLNVVSKLFTHLSYGLRNQCWRDAVEAVVIAASHGVQNVLRHAGNPDVALIQHGHDDGLDIAVRQRVKDGLARLHPLTAARLRVDNSEPEELGEKRK